VRDPLVTEDAPPAVAAVALARGSVIADRYRLEQRLGAGGGGTVWRCLDQQLGAVVALKIVSAGGDLERWRREVAMARRIADRNVCRVHDLGEAGELRFVTMELVEGDSLRSRIGAAVPAPDGRDARALFTQIVAGAAAIHAAGVVHRDLKPENIVVARDGRAVIVDFGLAREPRAQSGEPPSGEPPSGEPRPGEGHAPPDAVTRAVPVVPGRPHATVTGTGFVVGTPRYMSPEQAAGDTVDARTDVWALGLIAHELLAGTVPELTDSGPRIAGVVDDRWPGMAAIVRRCLAPAAGDRYADARVLHAALAPRTRRWPWRVAGAAAVAAIATLCAVLLTPRGPGLVAPAYRMQQLTTTTDWPAEAPASVAVSPDGTRFAYTTGNAKLYVRQVAGGPAVEWQVPKARAERAIAATVAGWFGDGSLAVVTTTKRDYQLVRVRETGAFDPLYASPQRILAAVGARPAGGDRVAIAIGAVISELPSNAQLATVPPGERVVAMAWSADGERLAIAQAGDEAVIRLARGDVLWRGRSRATLAPLLAWVGDTRLAAGYQEPETGVTSLIAIDTVTGGVTVRDQLAGELGAATAAGGLVLLLRGTAREAVHIRNRFNATIARAHPEATRGTQVAGWTPDGRLVFLEGTGTDARVVAARAGIDKAPWVTAPWPGSISGDVPDTMVVDSVIVHRVDPEDAGHVLVERISDAGARTRLARIDHDAPPAGGTLDGVVRCAGDRAAPCVVRRRAGDQVTWSELDSQTGAIGKLVYQRPVVARVPASAALSDDGTLLAVADGGPTITLVDVATGARLGKPPTRNPAARVQSVAFEANGDLWFTALDAEGRDHDFARVARKGGDYASYTSTDADEPLRWFGRAAPRLADKDLVLGVPVRDVRLEVWRADGF